MGNQTAAGMHKKLYATIKIFLIGLTMCSFYFGCKKKDLFSNQVQVLQNAHFYQRDASLAYLFKDINGPRADNLFLNNILEGLRRSDPSNRLANAVTKKLGSPSWDLSAVLKNSNGLRSIATPLVNEKKEVTGMILFTQESVTGIKYKILNRTNPQNKLPAFGNKEATQFTQASLKGLYQMFDQTLHAVNNQTAKHQSIRTNDIRISTVTVSYRCWNYEYSYFDPTVGVVIGRTQTQCMYWLTVTASSNEATLEYLEPEEAGLGGIGAGGDFFILNAWDTPNDTIIAHLDSFPCAQKALKNMYDVNSQITSLIHEIYGQNSFPKLTYRVRYDMGDSTVAIFIPDGSFAEFKGSINLNNKFLNGSQDYIIATMLHESLHSYIYWKYTEMVSINHDTTAFDLMFPIYSSIPRQSQRDHEEMANNYVNKISTILKQINPNLDNTISKALAWAGLEETSVYKNMNKDSTDKYSKINKDAIQLSNPANAHLFIKCK